MSTLTNLILALSFYQSIFFTNKALLVFLLITQAIFTIFCAVAALAISYEIFTRFPVQDHS